MNGKMDNGIHGTGQPDTPVETLVDILGRALQADDPKVMRDIVENAYKLAEGLDPYLDAISTPPSQVDAGPSYGLKLARHIFSMVEVFHNNICITLMFCLCSVK